MSTYAALRVALRGVASVASLVATSCRVVELRVAARGRALLDARGVALRCVEKQKYVFTSALVKAR